MSRGVFTKGPLFISWSIFANSHDFAKCFACAKTQWHHLHRKVRLRRVIPKSRTSFLRFVEVFSSLKRQFHGLLLFFFMIQPHLDLRFMSYWKTFCCRGSRFWKYFVAILNVQKSYWLCSVMDTAESEPTVSLTLRRQVCFLAWPLVYSCPIDSPTIKEFMGEYCYSICTKS